jgi:hypothetical protein
MQAAIISGPVVNPANGHSYYLLTQNTWTASEVEAVTLGGHLATVRSLSETQWIWDTLSPFCNGNLWIGLKVDGSSPLQWAWTSSEAVSYTNWTATNPDGTGFNPAFPTYTEMPRRYFTPAYNLPYQWDDIFDSGIDFQGIASFGVVEVIPEPASLSLLLAGLLAIRRRR